MNRTIVWTTIVLLVAAVVASTAVADPTAFAQRGVTPDSPAAPEERVYEVPPGTRLTPIVVGQYCNEGDCSSDRDRRCNDRGHGGASDSVFSISAEGSGSCLITCDDGYMLLIVEDNCAIGSSRLDPRAPRQRAVWFAPRERPCVDAHAIGSDEAICAVTRAEPATD